MKKTHGHNIRNGEMKMRPTSIRKGQKRMKTDFRFTQKFIRFGIREVLF